MFTQLEDNTKKGYQATEQNEVHDFKWINWDSSAISKAKSWWSWLNFLTSRLAKKASSYFDFESLSKAQKETKVKEKDGFSNIYH